MHERAHRASAPVVARQKRSRLGLDGVGHDQARHVQALGQRRAVGLDPVEHLVGERAQLLLAALVHTHEGHVANAGYERLDRHRRQLFAVGVGLEGHRHDALERRRRQCHARAHVRADAERVHEHQPRPVGRAGERRPAASGRRRERDWPSRARATTRRASPCASAPRRCRMSPRSTLPCWRTARRRPGARRRPSRSRRRPSSSRSRVRRPPRSCPRTYARAGCALRPHVTSRWDHEGACGRSVKAPCEFHSSPRFATLDDPPWKRKSTLFARQILYTGMSWALPRMSLATDMANDGPFQRPVDCPLGGERSRADDALRRSASGGAGRG